MFKRLQTFSWQTNLMNYVVQENNERYHIFSLVHRAHLNVFVCDRGDIEFHHGKIKREQVKKIHFKFNIKLQPSSHIPFDHNKWIHFRRIAFNMKSSPVFLSLSFALSFYFVVYAELGGIIVCYQISQVCIVFAVLCLCCQKSLLKYVCEVFYFNTYKS